MNTLASNNFTALNEISEEGVTYPASSSILDHALTDLTDVQFNISIRNPGLSDHAAVVVNANLSPTTEPGPNQFEHINYAKLDKLIPKLVANSSSADELVDKMEEAINSCTTTKQCRKKDDTWLTAEVQAAMATRDYYWKQWRKHPQDLHFRNQFKKHRNQVSALNRLAKKDFFHRAFVDCHGDSGKTWRVINEKVLNKKSAKNDEIKELEDENGTLITDPLAISEHVAEYFGNVGERLNQQLPVSQTDPLSNVKQNPSQISLTPVTEAEVRSHIKNLKLNCATGPDRISAKTIKKHSNIFVPAFTRFINKSFETGRFPKKLKIARGRIIFKSGNKKLVANYRPISILSILSKIWEKAMNDRIMKFLGETNYLDSNQYGFLALSNTAAAATDFVSIIQSALDKQNAAAATFIDVSKAFDSVDHKLLLAKLNKAGLSGPILKLLEDYLADRTFFAKIGSQSSSRKK